VESERNSQPHIFAIKCNFVHLSASFYSFYGIKALFFVYEHKL